MAKRGANPTLDVDINARLSAKVMVIYDRLLERYGPHPLVPRRDPMHELISTILSHRTTQRNEQLAYDSMWRVFGSWEAIRDAPVDKLTEAIKLSNFPEVKAPYIKGILATISERRGEYSIDFLKDVPVQEALDWLMSMPGVGIKTATLVLLFCFGKPVMPVDTHVHRVAQRTGLIGAKVSPTAAHPLLWALLPADPYILYNYHINNLLHGQRVCVAGTPRCALCPLTDMCDWYHNNRAEKE